MGRRVLQTTALLVAIIGIGLAFPLLPWHAPLIRFMGTQLSALDDSLSPAWWGVVGLHVIVLGCLAIGACGVPRPHANALANAPVQQRRAWLGRVCGVVLIAQPFLLLGLLLAATHFPGPVIAGLVLDPGPVARGVTGMLRDMVIWVVLTAAIEEWFFRGRLLPWLAGRLGPRSALSLSALAFAAAHGSVFQLVIAFPLGLLLGWARLRGAGLYACFAGHAIHNALLVLAGGALLSVPAIMLALLLGGLWLLATSWRWSQETTSPPPPSRLMFTAALVVPTALALWIGWRWTSVMAWGPAAAAQLTSERIPLSQALGGLTRLQTAARLDEARQFSLVLALATSPPSNRRTWALCASDWTQASDLARQANIPSYDLLLELWSCPFDHPGIRHAALLIGDQDAAALADFLSDHPPALLAWLPQKPLRSNSPCFSTVARA